MLNVEAADVDIALIIIDQRNVADVHRWHRFLRKKRESREGLPK